MQFEVTILGSNSAVPAHSRHPTSQVINVRDHLYLVDCGEGTQIQLSKYKIKRSRIDQIFISHLHGDHFFGLIGLITSYHLVQRAKPLDVFGPDGLEELLNKHLELSGTVLSYDLNIHAIDPGVADVIFEDDNVTVSTIPMDHRIPCCGFLFEERPRPPKIVKEKLDEHGVPVTYIGKLKEGKDYIDGDKVIANSELTEPPHPARRYAFCSDTAYNEKLPELLQGVDLIYHEATFGKDSAERANETFHSTAEQAGMVAAKSNAGALIIGHFSAKYQDVSHLLEEAKAVFANTELALEGSVFSIPLSAG